MPRGTRSRSTARRRRSGPGCDSAARSQRERQSEDRVERAPDQSLESEINASAFGLGISLRLSELHARDLGLEHDLAADDALELVAERHLPAVHAIARRLADEVQPARRLD